MAAAVSKDGNTKVNDLAASAPPVQILPLNIPFDGPGVGGLIGIPAYWPAGNMLFVTDAGPGLTGINAGVVGLDINPAPACNLSVAWSVALPSVADDQPPSPPTVADGLVFVASPNGGLVHAYDAATGTELWNSGAAISGATFAAPTVAAGTLYIGSWDGFAATNGGHLRACRARCHHRRRRHWAPSSWERRPSSRKWTTTLLERPKPSRSPPAPQERLHLCRSISTRPRRERRWWRASIRTPAAAPEH
jgi:hypothetical protein